MSALIGIFYVVTRIGTNFHVRKRGFAVKALQALEACTRSQREIFFSRWSCHGSDPDRGVRQLNCLCRRSRSVGDLEQIPRGFQAEHVEVGRGRHFLSIDLGNVLCRWFRRLRRYSRRCLEIRIRRGQRLDC